VTLILCVCVRFVTIARRGLKVKVRSRLIADSSVFAGITVVTNTQPYNPAPLCSGQYQISSALFIVAATTVCFVSAQLPALVWHTVM